MEENNKNTTLKIIPNDTNKEQKGINVPNLRFEGFTNRWEKKFLSAYMSVSPARNKNNLYTRTDVLSVSGDLGCVNQIELLGRSFAGESLIPYHIVELNDIVYTKSPLSENPYGIIKTNRYKTGIVSTLYAVYKAKETADNRFIEHYFSLKSRVNNYLKPIVRIGAKHDMKIGNEEVLNNYVIFPNKKEQQKISDFIDLLDSRINTQSKIIEDLESQIKWIRYKIFNLQNINNHKLSDYLTEYSEKNISNLYQPVAVGKYGIRKREDIYSKELASDYSKNKVIRKDTLIIGMGSTQIDIGILLDNEIFCVSPAYTTYKIKNINSFYLNEMLIYLNPLLSNKYMIISARQGKSVKKDELLSHKLYIHDIESQNKIERIFVLLYKRLNKEKDILMLYKKQKEYLLKNMFI